MASAPPPKINDCVECPYNKSHQILRARLQTHLIKCRKNYMDAKKVTCPFNSTHRINQQELDLHVTNCEDRASYERYKYVLATDRPGAGTSFNEPQPPENNTEVECPEDWSDICVESYNPNKYCSSAPVIRQRIGATPSERRAFRRAERDRLRGIDK